MAIRFVIEGVTLEYSETNVFGGLWYITLNGQIVVSNDVVGAEAPASDSVAP
jgi:hypothetical protein